MINTLRFIANHPLNRKNRIVAILRFVVWQIKTRLHNKEYIHQFTQNSKLIVRRGLTGATGNIYCGLHEFEDMAFLLHFLRPEDMFLDVGANVGSYTVLASGEIGSSTIAVEPIMLTFEYLKENLKINKIEHKVEPLNIGMGSSSGTLKFTSSLDTVNHVAASHEDFNTLEVPVKTMDEICLTRIPILIKIDVEGFETEVLKGAKNTIRNPQLKAIIIELNGSGQRYGYDEKLIHDELMSQGFKPHLYKPFDRAFNPVNTYGSHNTIYIKDHEFVLARIKSANKISLNGNSF